MVNKLTSPQKHKVKQSFFETFESFELTVYASLAYLKSLWKKCASPDFNKLFDPFTKQPRKWKQKLGHCYSIPVTWKHDKI